MDYLIILLAVVSLYILVTWHAKTSAYICKNCSNQFTLSAFQDLVSPQGLTTKYTKCPKCGKRTWAKIIDRID